MKADMINPFISAAARVLKEEMDMQVTRGPVRMEQSTATPKDVTVMIGVTGDMEGIVMYAMTDLMARRLVAGMLGTSPEGVSDKIVASGVGELGNVITGMASAGLESHGYTTDITPPTLIQGKNTIVSTSAFPRLAVTLESPLGLLDIHVALQERRKGRRGVDTGALREAMDKLKHS